jgi:hypothetical protein
MARNTTINKEIDDQLVQDTVRANSVVDATYKAKYAERAKTTRIAVKGLKRKLVARTNGDWLAQILQSETLDEKGKLRVGDFEAILDANGVKHDHWNRTTPGWQGRLRMTGRLAVQRVVAENGELALPDGETLQPPRAWVDKNTH